MKSNAMELYQLRSFLEIARTGNLTRAAGNLGISQSALSIQLKQLEEELDCPLFNRTARGMALTSAGETLQPHAEDTLHHAAVMKRTARDLSGRTTRTLKIGFNTDGAFLKVSRINRLLGQSLSTTQFVLVSSQTIRTPQMLRQGLIDMGFYFGWHMDPDISSDIISHFRVRIVVPVSMLSANPAPDWPALAALPWIWSVCDCPYYQVVQAEMEKYGLEPNVLVDAMDESVVKELVLDGQGVAILREDEARTMVDTGGKVRVIPDLAFEIPLQIAMLATNRRDPLLVKACDLIKQLWQEERIEA